jgi:DNA/RNA-binding domain of Phe-tRNA-synthetase-like protein
MTNRSWVDNEAAALGVKFRVAEIRGVQPQKKAPDVERLKRDAVERARAAVLLENEVLAGYRLLFDRVGASSYQSSPETLLQMALGERARLPQINTVVDAYNAVSLDTLMVVSAHDLDRIEGDARIEMTRGSELFHPLNGEPFLLPSGQWAGVADNHVLCQMNCKQSELSKVTTDTRNLLVYVQGNPNTSDEQVARTLRAVCETIVRFNGGETTYVPC